MARDTSCRSIRCAGLARRIYAPRDKNVRRRSSLAERYKGSAWGDASENSDTNYTNLHERLCWPQKGAKKGLTTEHTNLHEKGVDHGGHGGHGFFNREWTRMDANGDLPQKGTKGRIKDHETTDYATMGPRTTD
jgi:hypothetical protein